MWTFRILGALLLAALIVVGGILLLPSDRMARVLADQLRQQTGRAVEIGGEARISLWPELSIEVSDVSLGNPGWAGTEPMLVADTLAAGLSMSDLMGGAIRFTRLRAEAPVLRLMRHADGRGNWQFSETSGGGGALPPVALDLLELEQAQLIYSVPGAVPLVLGPLDATLRWPDPARPAEITATLPTPRQPVRLKASIDDFTGFLSGALVAADATAEMAGGTAQFKGRLNSAGAGEGRVTARTDSLAAMLQPFGLSGPVQKASLDSQITYASDGQLSLRNMDLRVGENALRGEADVLPGAPSQVTARLYGGDLDLTPYLPQGNGDADEGWSKTPIDAGPLALMEGTIRLTADSIDTGITRLGKTDARLSVERSRAVLKLAPASAFDGAVTGQLVANNRNGLSVGGRLQMTGVDMTRALGDLMGYTRLSGRADGTLEFLGVGQSVDAIMHSLRGAGSLNTGQGVIAGIDLDRLMGSGTGAGGTTVFDSLTGNFTMAKGDLLNDDLLMSLKNFRVDGKGRVGLGARDIDYLFTPVALRARGGQGIAIPVSVKGPWANPKIRADLEAAAKADLEAKQDEIEEEAKEKLREKLSEELEVQVTDEQSLEEALKDRLEDEAKKGLLRLLGAD